jgi:hypothetical protein
MKLFFQLMLGLLFVALGFFGGWIALLTWVSWRFPWQMCIGISLLCLSIHLVARHEWSQWLRFPAFGYLIGSALLSAMLAYGRMELTLCFGLITVSLLILSLTTAYGRAVKPVASIWAVFFGASICLFALDHAILDGRAFAWKWRVMEHPVFTPDCFAKVERHGRCAIYVTDVGFIDQSYAAVVWGWSLFPKVVFLEHDIPDDELLKLKVVQEVLQ